MTLKARVAALEAQLQRQQSPAGALPVVVEEHQLEAPESTALRAAGFVVVTFEQCVDLMV